MTSLPVVRHCIVCEDTRREAAGTLTILGYAGIAPFVRLETDVDKPLDTFTLLFLVEPGTGRHPVSLQIFDPEGDLLVGVDEPFQMTLGDEFLNYGVEASEVLFEKTGTYRIEMTSAGSSLIDTTFEVRRRSANRIPAIAVG